MGGGQTLHAMRINTEQYWAHAEAPLILRQAMFAQSCDAMRGAAAGMAAAQFGVFYDLQRSAWG